MKKIIGICLGLPQTIVVDQKNNEVIERKNIHPYIDDGQTWYEYDEYHYDLQEFFSLRFEQVRADIDYISMMAEVDL